MEKASEVTPDQVDDDPVEQTEETAAEVSRLGVAPVTREEILESLHEQDATREPKERGLTQAMEILAPTTV